jgi:bzd-type benzoyl-CoA reductase N subunit
MSTLEELTGIAGDLVNPALKAWKEEGKKVVGYFCSYVPEEVLYAADILPYRVRASGCTETSLADAYMSHLNCTFMRSCLQYALEGKYEFLDGIVVTNSCDHVRRMHDVLKETVKPGFDFVKFLSIPHKSGEAAAELYKDEIDDFRKSVEESFDVEITDAALKNAIDVYNETRSLLSAVYELRKTDNPPLTGKECMGVVLAGTMMPKDHFNPLLKKLLEELGNRGPVSGYSARLMIAGSGGCDNPGYYEIIEDLGGLIVTDSVCVGSRYFWQPVELNGDLTKCLANSYLKRPSCPSMVDSVAERRVFIKDMVKEFNVDGVIYQSMRSCDLWGGAVLDIRKNMKEAGIPFLEVEREYMLAGSGQLKTRVQAFLETIGG